MNNTIEKIVESVLIQNRIGNYTKKDLELQLQIHPSYPSFQSITDTLDYFDIDNIAVEIPMDALDQLPKSFISLITVENAEEIVTVIKKNDSIELKHTSLKKKKFTFNEFKEIQNKYNVQWIDFLSTVIKNDLALYPFPFKLTLKNSNIQFRKTMIKTTYNKSYM